MFRGSLSVKINLAIAAVLVVVMLGSALVAVQAQSRQAIENTKDQARILTKTLTNVIRMDMEGECQKDVMKIPQMMGEFQDIETIRIFDADGVIMHSADPSEVGQEIDELVFNVFQSPDRSKPFRSEEAGYRSFCMVEVLHNEPSCHSCHEPEKEIVGILEVCLSMAKTEIQIEQNARFLFGSAAAAVLLVSLAISTLLAVTVSRPVKALMRTMKQAEEGNLEARVHIRSGDELGQLGNSFNSMLSRLDGASREVDRLHREQMMRAERLASIGEMAASVAHEIKNPLAGLAGATQILAKSFGPGDERYPVIQEMLKLTGRLDKTIRDLLSFAREAEPAWRDANLNDVVEETLFFIAREEGGGAEGVETVLDPDMPAVPMDPEQIQQVLFNLIQNAKQAPGPDVQVSVCTSGRPTLATAGELVPADWVEVCVRDTGPGIAPELQAEIFKPFFTTKNQGTGLGLPISRRIVEAHGGVLHLESRAGQGSAFYVWLPRERANA